MGTFYKVTNTGKIIHIPSYNVVQYSLNGTFYTITAATQASPQVFDHTYTYFFPHTSAGRDSLMRLSLMGFTDLVQLEDNMNEYWYLTETKRLHLTQNGVEYQVFDETQQTWNNLGSAGVFGGGRSFFTLYTYFNGITASSLIAGSSAFGGAPPQPYFSASSLTGSPLVAANKLTTFFTDIDPFINPPSDDPYSGAGASGPGGGDGTFDFSSTPIDYPGLPTIGAYSTGFLNVYVPSAANLRSLAAYMWAGAFDIDNFRKLVADPMDAIMGLSIVPVTASEIGVESTTLIVGNISTGISMPRALSQYVAVDCGTIEMPAKWGAYLDFSPYTKLQLYLPYIGFVDISPDDVMTANEGNEDDKLYPGTIGVQYHVDILSGSCIAFVKCRDHVIYEFGGQCACSCPVTEGQYKNGLLGMLEIISTVASTASAVAGGPGAKATKANREASKIGKIGAVAEGALGVIDTSISMIKPNITRSGSVGGSNGLMGYQIPYLVLTVPHMCIPGDQNVYIGYPSFVTLTMSDLAGFTQIQVTHLLNMSCTSDEADEIISLLSEGVIF